MKYRVVKQPNNKYYVQRKSFLRWHTFLTENKDEVGPHQLVSRTMVPIFFDSYDEAMNAIYDDIEERIEERKARKASRGKNEYYVFDEEYFYDSRRTSCGLPPKIS